jgi:2-keto-4-pentenoate hydratase
MTSLPRRQGNARLTGGVVDPASSERPNSEEDAYALQHEIVALSGHACLGYKVGSTSVEAQRLLGTDEPGSGVLLAPYVHQSPARITISAPTWRLLAAWTT